MANFRRDRESGRLGSQIYLTRQMNLLICNYKSYENHNIVLNVLEALVTISISFPYCFFLYNAMYKRGLAEIGITQPEIASENRFKVLRVNPL